ncbi:MAG: 1,4-alpha-glucan branching protein GlgB [Weeksellaceae bacterium]
MPKSFTLFTEEDIRLFKAGRHYRLYEKFGSRRLNDGKTEGVYFAVWAPNAKSVSVIGDFNRWNRNKNKMVKRKDGSGIWEAFFPQMDLGVIYKYSIQTKKSETLEKIDPFAFSFEIPPKSASVVTSTWYKWKDGKWMKKRHRNNSLKKPISIYEVHLGSWRRDPAEPDRWLTFVEISDKLIAHIKKTGFTHVEFMPVMEHPYPPSWGYQITGFFAPTSRYGTPQELMYLIQELHNHNIGVIMDWVPSHFPNDDHGLYKYDGTHLYEHADSRLGFHPDWKSSIFNYGKNEVRSFLISNAMFWLERYHIDGLRVDAVSSMLYLNYSRNEGEWLPNKYGGNENLEAISFLKELNETLYLNFPDIQMTAEEASAWPKVSHPTTDGGLGFGMKWMMGWMNDTLDYFKTDPYFRKQNHHKLTFSIMYAFNENFILPFSHDEVVHGKSPMLYKMPGEERQKHANLRAMYLYMFTHPGAKLMFMGDEFGETTEWNYDHSLSWHLLDYEAHKKLMDFVSELNRMYKTEKGLYHFQFDFKGFEWIDADDEINSVYVYLRKAYFRKDDLLIVLNLTPIERKNYRVAFPEHGIWKCILNSDDELYWGSGSKIQKIKTQQQKFLGRNYSAKISLPPLSGLIFKLEKKIILKKKSK